MAAAALATVAAVAAEAIVMRSCRMSLCMQQPLSSYCSLYHVLLLLPRTITVLSRFNDGKYGGDLVNPEPPTYTPAAAINAANTVLQ